MRESFLAASSVDFKQFLVGTAIFVNSLGTCFNRLRTIPGQPLGWASRLQLCMSETCGRRYGIILHRPSTWSQTLLRKALDSLQTAFNTNYHVRTSRYVGSIKNRIADSGRESTCTGLKNSSEQNLHLRTSRIKAATSWTNQLLDVWHMQRRTGGAGASGAVEPNPMVGCVVARGAEILGEGWHRRFGGAHAEVEAR